MMYLRTLGTFELTDVALDGTSVQVMGPQKPLALLAYLALAPRLRATRDVIQDLLWGDVPPDRGRRTLRQSVWSLRQRLADESLRSEGDDLVLALPLRVDCQEFEAAVAGGDLESAWALYRGHFIPAFAAPGGAQFEHWADLQREHLRAMWLAVGTELLRERPPGMGPHKAVAIARQLRDEFPERLELWTTLLRTLLAEGERMQALVEAETLEARLRTEGRRPDPETRAILDRIRALPANGVTSSPERLHPDLVGREQVFASLLAAWQSGVSGKGRSVVVRGAAGLGKTRLLHDFQQRLLGIGVRTVAVRARQADRDLPFGLVAGLAEGLGRLPGAVGVSPAAAATLVGLVPSLSDTFPRTRQTAHDPDDLLRLRALALAELVQSVAEESPIALLVDDLHWSDEASRQILGSLSSRVADLPVLLVLTLRPIRRGWSVPPGADLSELQPLSVGQLEDLISSVASCDPTLQADLGRILYNVSVGVPLTALSAIELAVERRLLRIENEQWHCPSVDALRQALADGSVLEQWLAELPSGGLELVLALSLAGRPLDEEIFAVVSDQPEWSALAGALEHRGLLNRVGSAWDLAHDRFAEAAVVTADPEVRRRVSRRLGKALLDGPDQSARTVRLAGRLLTGAGDPDGAVCFRRWLVGAGRKDYWRNPAVAAAEFLGEDATMESAGWLARRIPRLERFGRGYPQLAVGVGLILVAGLGAGIVQALGQWLEPRATSMILNEPRTSRGFLWDTTATSFTDPSKVRNPIPIAVTFHAADGAPSRRTPDSATVRLVESRGVNLGGAVVQPVVRGRAEFPDLVALGAGAFRLEVQADRLTPVRSAPLFNNGGLGGMTGTRLTIVGGQINGQRVDSGQRIVRVAPGALLEGTLHFRALNTWRDAAIIMGAIATWGDRRTNLITLTALPSHGTTDAEFPLADAITGKTFRAPIAPGRYRLVFLMDAEADMESIASRTNWTIGTPIWFDGNDVVEMSLAALQALDSEGVALLPKRYRENLSDMLPIAGTTIEIVVEKP